MKVVVALLICMLSLVSSFTSISPIKLTHRLSAPNKRMELAMSGKQSKFGIFSPAVYAAKFVLGEAKLNKVSGL